MAISNDSIQKLLLLLRPYLRNESERRAYLMRALGTNADALNLIWNEPVNTFIPNMVQTLVAFGEITPGQPALCALLEVIREDVGVDVRLDIDELLLQLKKELKTPEPNVFWKGVQTLKGHSELVRSVAISPDGQTLASGSSDQTIKLWNPVTGGLLGTLTGHSSAVLSLTFSPDGQTLVSASQQEFLDGNIKLWDVSRAKLRQTLGNSLVSIGTNCVSFSPDGQTLATAHFDAAIRLWQISTGKLQRTLRGHGYDVNSVTFSRDGRLLVSGGVDGAIMVWNFNTGERLHTLNRTSDVVHSLVSWLDRSVGSIKSVAISPDGKIIASGGNNAGDNGVFNPPIKLWDINTGRAIPTLIEQSGTVYSVAFSPNGKILASGDDENKIKIWNVKTGELIQSLEHYRTVNSVIFSPDGKSLVSGSDDKTIKIWRRDY